VIVVSLCNVLRGEGRRGLGSHSVRAAEQRQIQEARLAVKSEPGPPATLGSSAAAGVRLIVWCRDCRHQTEPDPAEQAERYGAEMTVPDWHERLVCSQCGSQAVDIVVTGRRR
jgi:hypothetical protein